MMPDADDCAIAIVAACRETGENPLKIEIPVHRMHARHYAVHALLHVFQKASPHRLVKALGVEHPKVWWTTSRNMCIAKHPSQPCGWWSDEAYDRVIRAIEADRTRRSVKPKIKLSAVPDAYISSPDTTRSAAKLRLEEMLRQAVLNTAKIAE